MSVLTTAFEKAELSLINQSNTSRKVREQKKITTSVKKKIDIQFSSWFISGKLKLIVCHYWLAGCLRKLLQSLSFWFSYMDQYKPILFQFYNYWFSDITSVGEHSSPAMLKNIEIYFVNFDSQQNIVFNCVKWNLFFQIIANHC